MTEGAEQDLEAIHDYIAEFDSVASAHHVLDQLLEVVESLAQLPERGSFPAELVALGIKEYRQAWFKPYRVIYRVIGNQVIILARNTGPLIPLRTAGPDQTASCSL